MQEKFVKCVKRKIHHCYLQIHQKGGSYSLVEPCLVDSEFLFTGSVHSLLTLQQHMNILWIL